MSIVAPQPIVVFGNPNPQMTHKVTDQHGNETKVQRPAEHLNGFATTHIELRPEVLDPEHVEHTLSTDNDKHLSRLAQVTPDEFRRYVLMLHEMESLLQVHSGSVDPTWVRSDDPALSAALAAHFNCPDLGSIDGMPTALRTNAGRDLLLQQQLFTSQPAAANYGALSANTGGAFAATDTTLAGEITTASGGLIRKLMTAAHTTGTNTATLTATWTANGSDALAVVVATWANFNQAVSGGSICDEDVLNSTATLNVSGDSVTITYTLTN